MAWTLLTCLNMGESDRVSTTEDSDPSFGPRPHPEPASPVESSMRNHLTSWKWNRGISGCARLSPFGLLLVASISSGQEAGKAGSSGNTLGAEREPTAELRLVSARPLGIESAVEEALRGNPELQAARRSVQAAEQRIRPAGALADPEIELNVSDLGMDGGARRSELMVRQMFDWPGKRPLMREEMRAMAGMSAQEAAEMGLEVAARVREAYWELHRVRENLELSDKTLQILRDFVQYLGGALCGRRRDPAGRVAGTSRGLQARITSGRVQAGRTSEPGRPQCAPRTRGERAARYCGGCGNGPAAAGRAGRPGRGGAGAEAGLASFGAGAAPPGSASLAREERLLAGPGGRGGTDARQLRRGPDRRGPGRRRAGNDRDALGRCVLDRADGVDPTLEGLQAGPSSRRGAGGAGSCRGATGGRSARGRTRRPDAQRAVHPDSQADPDLRRRGPAPRPSGRGVGTRELSGREQRIS